MRCRAPRAGAALLAVAGALLAAQPAAAQSTPTRLTAKTGILVEPSSGEVLWQRAADRRRSIASTTKLMTALLVLEHSKLSDVVPAADYRALPVESKINLRPGERMTVADLMRALLVYSANDAAATLAQHVAGSRPAFVRLMNKRARELKLTGTHYANPVGLDDVANYSTARDLVKLTERLWRFKFFRRTVNRESIKLKSGDHPRSYDNRNTLVRRYRWVDGVKTGHTGQAGYVLVGAGRRNGVQLFSAVLGTPSEAARDADTLALLRYGFTLYERGDRDPARRPPERDDPDPLPARRGSAGDGRAHDQPRAAQARGQPVHHAGDLDPEPGRGADPPRPGARRDRGARARQARHDGAAGRGQRRPEGRLRAEDQGVVHASHRDRALRRRPGR